jgi:hypothetical protein
MVDFAYKYLLYWNLKPKIYGFEDYGPRFMILCTNFIILKITEKNIWLCLQMSFNLKFNVMGLWFDIKGSSFVECGYGDL